MTTWSELIKHGQLHTCVGTTDGVVDRVSVIAPDYARSAEIDNAAIEALLDVGYTVRAACAAIARATWEWGEIEGEQVALLR